MVLPGLLARAIIIRVLLGTIGNSPDY